MPRARLIVIGAVAGVGAIALFAGRSHSPEPHPRGARPAAVTPASPVQTLTSRELVGSWRPVITPELEERIRDAHRVARRSAADAEAAVNRIRLELDGRRVEIDGETIAAFKGHERLSLQGYAVRSTRAGRVRITVDSADGGLPSEVVVRKLGPSRIALVLPAVAPDYEIELVREN